MPVAAERTQLSDTALGSARAREVEQWLGHASLDQPGTDGVDAHALAAQQVGGGLHQADHACLARAVWNAARARAQPGHRRRAYDRALATLHHVRRRVLDRE